MPQTDRLVSDEHPGILTEPKSRVVFIFPIQDSRRLSDHDLTIGVLFKKHMGRM